MDDNIINELGEKNDRIEELKGELEEKDKRYITLSEEYSELEEELEEKAGEIDRLEDKIEDLINNTDCDNDKNRALGNIYNAFNLDYNQSKLNRTEVFIGENGIDKIYINIK